MAPPKKRVTTSEDQEKEQISKKVKGDINLESEVSTEKHTNNNNNAIPAAGETNGDIKDEKTSAQVEKEANKDDETQVNGAKEVADKARPESEDQKKSVEPVLDEKKTSELNGNKKAEGSTEIDNDSSTKDAPKDSTEDDEEQVGTFLICGGANWDLTGRKELPKNAKKPAEVDPAARNLWAPHRVILDGSDKPIRVKGVFSGCIACHSVIITEDGLVMTFGRNDKGQLGLGDTETRITPVVIEEFKGIDIVAAACGRSHTLFLSSDGLVFACGDNKMGQCGTNQQSVHQITTPTRIAFRENKPIVRIACGAEFSMIVDDEGRLYSFGHPEHGQLGHGSEAKYFTSGNKYAFHCEYQPRRVVTFIEKSREGHVSPVDDVFIVDIACGVNHTLAVDKTHRCFSWGFAGYHRLGHSETKNELVPRSIKVFDGPRNSGRGAAKVFAGATHSMALDVNGLLYFWGQNKSSGEATMYPKNVQDLCGWKISAVSCANRSIFVVADETCISWGPSPTYGELGYGEGKSKSSTIPQEVKTLEGLHIYSVACGFGHTMLITRDKSAEEQALLGKLKSWP